MSVTNTVTNPLATLSSSSVGLPTSAVGGITASSPGRITSLGSVSSALRTGYSVTATRWTRSTSRYSYTSTRSSTRSATATPASPGFTSHSGVPWFGFAIPIIIVGLSLTIGCLVYAYRLNKLRKQIEALPDPDVEATGDGAPPPYMANTNTCARGTITPGPFGTTSLTRSTSTPAMVSRFRRDSTGRLIPTAPEVNDTVPAYAATSGPTAPAQTDSDFMRSVRADPFLSNFVRLESSESTPRQPARPVQMDGDQLPSYEAARNGR